MFACVNRCFSAWCPWFRLVVQVGVALSADNVFQQVSYVNAICTIKGGTHVEYVANQVIAKLLPVLKRKNKAEVGLVLACIIVSCPSFCRLLYIVFPPFQCLCRSLVQHSTVTAAAVAAALEG